MKAVILKGIREGEMFSTLWQKVNEFKEAGGTQDEALQILEELRITFQDEEEKEDQVLEIMDCVVGWCHKRSRIW